jgi:hypothetical protein
MRNCSASIAPPTTTISTREHETNKVIAAIIGGVVAAVLPVTLFIACLCGFGQPETSHREKIRHKTLHVDPA